MVASRQMKIPYYKGIGGERETGFGAIAKIIGRTKFPFFSNYVVSAAKRVGANLMELAAPETAEVVSGRKSSESAAKIARRQTFRKQMGSGSKQRRVIPTKPTKQASRSRRGNFTNISHESCQTIFSNKLCGSFWKSSRESPSS